MVAGIALAHIGGHTLTVKVNPNWALGALSAVAKAAEPAGRRDDPARSHADRSLASAAPRRRSRRETPRIRAGFTSALALGPLLFGLGGMLAGCESGDCTPRRDVAQSLFCQVAEDNDPETACLGLSAGEVCGRLPQARLLRCTAAARCTCGNGEVDEDEECDRSAGMQGCSDDCRLICASDAQCSFLPRSECRAAWVCDTTAARCVPGPPLPPDTPCGGGLTTCNDEGLCGQSASDLGLKGAPTTSAVPVQGAF